MQYVGGKARSASWLKSVVSPWAVNCHTYLEPFIGGGNALRVLGDMCPVVLASDADADLMLLWKAVASGWVPPQTISKEKYYSLMKAAPSPLRTFAGFGCSFGGKWFAGYASNRRGDNYCRAAARSIAELAPVLKKAGLRTCEYHSWEPGSGWIVYCDPPYKGTTGYKQEFDHFTFWEIMRRWSCAGALVFVSEYHAPQDFVCIATRNARKTLSAQGSNAETVQEKLFIYP